MRKRFLTVSSVVAALAFVAAPAPAQLGSGSGPGGGAPPVVPSDVVIVSFDDFVGAARNTVEALELTSSLLGPTEYPELNGKAEIVDGEILVGSFNVWDNSGPKDKYQGQIAFYQLGNVIEFAAVERWDVDADQSTALSIDAGSRLATDFVVNAHYDVAADGRVTDYQFTHSPIPETPGVGATKLECVKNCLKRFFGPPPIFIFIGFIFVPGQGWRLFIATNLHQKLKTLAACLIGSAFVC